MEAETGQFCHESADDDADTAGFVEGAGPLDFRHTSGPGDAVDLVKRLQRASTRQHHASST